MAAPRWRRQLKDISPARRTACPLFTGPRSSIGLCQASLTSAQVRAGLRSAAQRPAFDAIGCCHAAPAYSDCSEGARGAAGAVRRLARRERRFTAPPAACRTCAGLGINCTAARRTKATRRGPGTASSALLHAMDPSAGHQQPTSPLAATGGAPAYYPPPPAAAAAAAPPPAAGYYPPPPHAAAAAPGPAAAGDGQPTTRPHYAAAAGAGALPEAAPAATAPAPAVVPGVGSKRSYDDSGAGAAAADGYGHAAADAAAKRQQLDVAAAAPAAAVPMPAAAAAPAASNRPSAASIPRETIYRLVLDVVDTALIIGRGGNTVRSIEQATGAAAGGVVPGEGAACRLLAGLLLARSGTNQNGCCGWPTCRWAHQAASRASGGARADAGHLEQQPGAARPQPHGPQHRTGAAAASCGWSAAALSLQCMLGRSSIWIGSAPFLARVLVDPLNEQPHFCTSARRLPYLAPAAHCWRRRR